MHSLLIVGDEGRWQKNTIPKEVSQQIGRNMFGGALAFGSFSFYICPSQGFFLSNLNGTKHQQKFLVVKGMKI
jgi:hypothetical protein